MLETVRRLALGLALIAAASAVLLQSDLGSRHKSRITKEATPDRVVKAALLQHAAQSIIDEGCEGIISGLAERGWVAGKNLQLRRYNAEGDNTVGQAIARQMVNEGNDLLLTVTTPSLLAVANANKNAQIPHVFGLVADPASTGLGFSRDNPLEHPAWMAGYGTMQPVKRAFELARQINPSLKSVGVAWNTSEANAEAQMKVARKVCADMGISLSEINVENSAGVGEAAAALQARGVEAIWVCGDTTVMTAIDTLIAAAKKGRIPVFTVLPPNVQRGALFDIGADYHEVGRLTGLLAGDVLNGRKPATIPVENVMPEIFTVNLQAAAEAGPKWTIPEELVQKARTVIEPSGQARVIASATPRPTPTPKPNPSGKKWKIALVLFSESPPAEETLEGMKDEWKKSVLVEGKDYEIKLRCAQGDIAALSGIYDAVMTDGADLVVPISTPSLQAALHKVREVPIVFSLVANPMAAGAGKSYTDHMPNVTGVAVMGPAADMLDMIAKYFPQYKKLGTLFCPAEANSVALKEALEKLCAQRGFTLECVAANSPGELPDAALSLVSRPIDAVMQISDNISSAGFTAIAKAARQSKKPLISLNSTTVPLGAAVAMGRDYHHAGEVTVDMIEQVIAGGDPGKIPFMLPPNVVLTVSPTNAAAVGMTIPEGLMKKAKVAP